VAGGHERGSVRPHEYLIFKGCECQPQSLTDDEVYAVTAYLLSLNGIIGESVEMNAQTLPKVKMPNHPNFIIVYPSRLK
jgi:hypothetical protein